jgi:hypothetical protein
MKTSALVMGIVGGVFGMLLALFAMAVGNLGNDTTVGALGAAAFVFAIVGIIGGALTGSRSGWAAALLLVAGIGIIVSISAFGILPGALFLLGSLFAFLYRRGERQHEIPLGIGQISQYDTKTGGPAPPEPAPKVLVFEPSPGAVVSGMAAAAEPRRAMSAAPGVTATSIPEGAESSDPADPVGAVSLLVPPVGGYGVGEPSDTPKPSAAPGEMKRFRRFCTNCGSEFGQATGRFCSECGAAREETASPDPGR